jgi:hypothetical protein
MPNKNNPNTPLPTITVDATMQEELKKEIDQQRLPAIRITYSYEEAEMLGAFEEHALSEADALEAIEESAE